MKAEPLPKELFDKLKKAKVTEVTLRWMGGSDEANLEVSLCGINPAKQILQGEVESWAWEAYDYNCAGDGTEYGDDVVYNLVKGEVSTQEWSNTPVYDSKDINKLEVK